MKPHTKAAAAFAAKWALWLSGGIILGPIVIGLASGFSLSGKIIAEKLIVGIAWFPILFFGFWVWGTFSKKDPNYGCPDSTGQLGTRGCDGRAENISTENAPLAKAGKWNYIGIGVGVFMLLFLFLPQIISDTLANQYYLGAAFWVGVIIYCSLNILRAR